MSILSDNIFVLKNVFFAHHFVVRIDEVSTPMAFSAGVQVWPVCQEPILIVDSHPGRWYGTFVSVLTTSQYHYLLQLYAAG